MENAAHLYVPLKVNIFTGKRWGSLTGLGGAEMPHEPEDPLEYEDQDDE